MSKRNPHYLTSLIWGAQAPIWCVTAGFNFAAGNNGLGSLNLVIAAGDAYLSARYYKTGLMHDKMQKDLEDIRRMAEEFRPPSPDR